MGFAAPPAPPDLTHPFGYGRELYFWSFIVALLVFAVGSGVAFYEGVTHILAPKPATNLAINYIVLCLSVLFEGYSWRIALKEFRLSKGRLGYFEAVRRSKDPSVFTILFEDSAALLGLFVALSGISAAHYFDMPVLDGVASVGIAFILAATAMFLARESKALLLGEPALPEVQETILRVVRSDRDVQQINGMTTVHLGPEQIVITLSLEFKDELTTSEIEVCVERLEAAIRKERTDIVSIFVKPQTSTMWRQRRALLKK
jgi:cation diffusion facilitator family transporter